MADRPELRVEVEREHPQVQTFLGVLSYPALAEITVRWHYGDSERALALLEQAYFDAKAQIEVTLSDTAVATERAPE